LALKVRTKKDFPEEWASTQNNLGLAYRNRIRWDRAWNLEKAIEAYKLALEVYTKKDFPEEWASTQKTWALLTETEFVGTGHGISKKRLKHTN
ncbi:tetratricopeptide repeat protein, partial [Moorena sp. SIO4G3]|uniref:tetratricopeptide repeat protein n=1 Tax=Moorena sp. SIO4G3 TaxID=2607821 RepID=UPI00142B6E5C|nr:tetratricopeptide repeat protein [Moorena sp. SIO4G3]